MITIFIGFSFNSTIEGQGLRSVKNNNPVTESYGELKVYFIDVGQGDSILIETPENNFILIDTGERSYSSTVINFLYDHSVYNLLAFVGTHPHADHIGGAEEIFNAFNVLSAYDPGYPSTTQTYQRFLNAVQNEGCPLYTDDDLDPGDYIDLGSIVSCQVLNINKDASNANDASIVLRLDYFGVSFLFTGDIHGDKGDYVEIDIVDNWDVNVDILKVAHHGSRDSSINYFLDEATPELSVICCGEGNIYGHPHVETLNRLQNHFSQIYRTDLNGDIMITTDGFSWDINYEKPDDKPVKPTITGTTYGDTGIEYQYGATTSDPNGDKIYYLFDWMDGNTSEWIGPLNSGETAYAWHKWTMAGTYVIKVKAKDTEGHESEWGLLNVIMPRNKEFKRPIFNILLKYPFIMNFLQKFVKI